MPLDVGTTNAGVLIVFPGKDNVPSRGVKTARSIPLSVNRSIVS